MLEKQGEGLENFTLDYRSPLLRAFIIWNIKRISRGVIITILGNWNTRVLRARDAIIDNTHFFSYFQNISLGRTRVVFTWIFLFSIFLSGYIFLFGHFVFLYSRTLEQYRQKNHRRMWKGTRRILHFYGKALYIPPPCLFLPRRVAWIKPFLKWENHRFGVPPSLLRMIEYVASMVDAPSLFINVSSQPWVFAYLLLVLRLAFLTI